MERSKVMKTVTAAGSIAPQSIFNINEPAHPYISYPQTSTVRDASFSSYLRPMPEQIAQVDDPEISIFDAQKYFNESGGDPKLSKRVSVVSANLERISERYDFSSVPRLSSASISVDGYGRNYRARSFHATPTASSEASWNSRAGLLSNPPGAVVVSMRSPPRNDDRRKGSGKKWLLGRKCPCLGKKSVQIEGKLSEPRTPSRKSHTNGLSLDLKRQIQIPTSVENPIEKSLATPDWLKRHEVIPSSHRMSADGKLHDASSFNARRLAATHGGNLYSRQILDEPRTPSIAPTECYEPSEASIDWSVTTAEGFDRGSVTNFSVSASEVDETTMMRGREYGKSSGGGGGKKRGGNGGLLMSCRCEKAVSVGPHPVKCVPAEGQRVASSSVRHVGGRPATTIKPPLARSHSARLSLPFAT